MIDGGYILLARKTADSELMDKPPLYAKLWLWMLVKANWKDRDKLKRGQFFTTIEEMRQAMSYKIGYRRVTPTKDEIRSAYEALAKATMITTAKTTRGMIITICNYDYYQNPKNYEAHTETHTETPTKPTEGPHYTEEGLRINKINPPLSPLTGRDNLSLFSFSDEEPEDKRPGYIQAGIPIDHETGEDFLRSLPPETRRMLEAAWEIHGKGNLLDVASIAALVI